MLRREILTTAVAAAVTAAGGAGRAKDRGDHMRTWLERWLTAFNDPDLGVYKAFVTRTAPTVVPYVDDDLALREVTGGFDLIEVESSGPEAITALVRDRSWDRRSRVRLEAANDRQLTDIGFAGAPAGQTTMRLDEASAIRSAQDKLEYEARAGRLNGAFLVARGETPLLRLASGLADEVATTGNRPDTRFCIGSMGKMFTAVAVMQLVEAGALRLDAALREYLPHYPNAAVADRVTIRHLLTHTGGTGDIFGPAFDGLEGASAAPESLVALYGHRDPEFEPGSRWGYSNYGFVLLGRVLERVRGQDYGALVDAHVFQPSSMVATSLRAADGGRAAIAYTGARATGLKALPRYIGLPAGGGYSTVDDLHAFVASLRKGKLVRPETLKAMSEPQVTAGSGHWGLGFAVRERNGLRYFGHGGSAPGVNGDLAIFPAYTTIALCNRGHPAATCVADFIGARLPQV